MKCSADVKPNCVKQDIHWIVLEEDKGKSRGTYLFLFTQRDAEKCDFDNWYETTELAKKVAQKEWGIEETDWKKMD